MRSIKRPEFLGSTAVCGVGMTKLTKASGRTVLEQAVEAGREAITDAGMAFKDVDGVISFSYNNDSVPAQAVATGLGLPTANLLLDVSLGGQAPCYLVMLAANAVNSGLARSVLVYRALNGRSGARVGSTPVPSEATPYRYPVGFVAYPQYIAMWARRYLIETGATEDALGAVAVAQRQWASMNDCAIRRDPLSMEQYLSAPYVAAPLRAPDCTSEVDGAAAVLVTSLEAARDGQHRPVVLQGAAYVAPRGVGLDMGDALLWDDMSRNYTSFLADDLWGSAGMSPNDVDLAQLYDCFTSSVLFALEGLGIVERGEAGDFISEGNTGQGGQLPMNTNGGLLCEGYLHGMNTVVEAVRQLQQRAGGRTVESAETAVVTSGALMDGSALVLAGDR